MSTVPLSELYAGAERVSRRARLERSLNTNVESAAWDEATSQWSLATRTGNSGFGFLILALPFEATRQAAAASACLLMAQTNWRDRSSSIEHWPICSVHLWFDREITDLDHAVLLDREIHWLYNKSRLQPWRKLKGSYVELVVSASRSFAALTARRSDRAGGDGNLREFFPAVTEAKLEKAALVKEVRATFGVPPGIDASRPTAAFAVAELLSGRRLDRDRLAFDDGERGARSGHLAAEAVCAKRGSGESDADCRAVIRDLQKPQGIDDAVASILA